MSASGESRRLIVGLRNHYAKGAADRAEAAVTLEWFNRSDAGSVAEVNATPPYVPTVFFDWSLVRPAACYYGRRSRVK